MITMKQASSRVRSNRGSSFLTKGADEMDHQGLNKARRSMDTAVIGEQLWDVGPEAAKIEEDNTPDYRFKAVAYLYDGDKDYLDGWEVVGVFETQEEAQEKIAAYGRDEDQARKPYWECVDVKADWEAREHLEYQEAMKSRSWLNPPRQ